MNTDMVFATPAFLHYFSEEVPTGERGIRTSEKTPSLTLTE
jgi:hypothetical protein